MNEQEKMMNIVDEVDTMIIDLMVATKCIQPKQLLSFLPELLQLVNR